MILWDFLQGVHPFAGFSAVIGLLITLWLLWDIWYSRRPSVRIDSEWRTTQQQHDRLSAAADPFHFRPMTDKAAKGFKKANQKVIP